MVTQRSKENSPIIIYTGLLLIYLLFILFIKTGFVTLSYSNQTLLIIKRSDWHEFIDVIYNLYTFQ